MTSVEDRIDELYAGPADGFISARDALAKELKAGGDKDGAATVKALRKPTVAAWAVNQVARTERRDVAKLLDVGDALRVAHDALLSGDGDAGVRASTAERRDLVGRLTDAAVALLGPGGDAQRDAISNTFDAAVADPDAGITVQAGRLAKELPAPSGFGGGLVFGDPSPPVSGRAGPRRPADKTAKTTAKNAAKDDDGGAEAAAATEERRRHDEHVARLRSELEQRRADADEATKTADAANEEVERLRSLLDEAESAAREADTAARRARKAADQAQRELDRATAG